MKLSNKQKWAIGITVLASLSIAFVLEFRPFISQKKNWILLQSSNDNDRQTMADFLSKSNNDEISSAYQYLRLIYKKPPGTVSDALQTKIDAITAKYGIFG